MQTPRHADADAGAKAQADTDTVAQDGPADGTGEPTTVTAG
ncbi:MULTISPECIES: hypothetical protein [unclassified Streptomyces]|nr:hypothetical protein [Streptomyces sp. VMFN-G11Ma]